jgi:hypothetical protein
MVKKRYLFGATAVVGLGSLVYGLRNPASLVPLANNLPFSEVVNDASALDGSDIYRKKADPDGVTRFTYAFMDSSDKNDGFYAGDRKPVFSEKVKQAVLHAFEDASHVANVEFKEVDDFGKAEIKVSQLTRDKEHSGLGVPVTVPFIGGNMMVSDISVPVISESEINKGFDCTFKDTHAVCSPRQATPAEIEARRQISQISDKRLTSRLAKHELLHVLGAKHAHHADPGFGSMKKLHPDQLDDFSKTLMIYSGSYSDSREDSNVAFGKMDIQFLQKHYGKPKGTVPSK